MTAVPWRPTQFDTHLHNWRFLHRRKEGRLAVSAFFGKDYGAAQRAAFHSFGVEETGACRKGVSMRGLSEESGVRRGRALASVRV